LEQIYCLQGRKRFRPFVFAANVTNRSYSTPLQRRIADFGADEPFAKVNKKLKEHYGITVPLSAARTTTLKHAENIKKIQDVELGTLKGDAKQCVISETDGSMIPIVATGNSKMPGDKRKQKSLFYKEARLSLSHAKGSVTPVFSATMGDVKQAGLHLAHCVHRVGINDNTQIHGIGDGAPWIADQVEEQFGSQATYLIDMYHTCEYLGEASATCAPGKEKIWMEKQKERLRASKIAEICQELKLFMEKDNVADKDAPVRRAYRYINNRIHQMDYKAAIDNDLPIGSGEIESAHRYVIQKRLKIAGSWWLERSADNMLALRVNRANGDWDEYWEKAA